MPKKTAVKGPKDGKIVQANFTGNAKSLFPSLKTTKDLVLLSILGNELCAGEYLGAIVKQAVATHEPGVDDSDENRGKTTFLIADEIYWHNLKSLSPENDDITALKAQALVLGDNYFNDNLEHFLAPLELTLSDFDKMTAGASTDQKITLINQLAAEKGLNFEIVRWQTWVTQDHANKIKKMIPLYDTVEGLHDSIVETVEDFVKRHSEDEGSTELWKHRSKGYLTEESPSVMWLAASLGYNFVIYPGGMITAFS